MDAQLPINTTLAAIRSYSPCEDGWVKLLKHLGKTTADDEPLAFSTILTSNGVDDALWCLRALPEQCHSRIRQWPAISQSGCFIYLRKNTQKMTDHEKP